LQHALFRSRARKKFSEGVGVVKDGVIHSTRRKVFPSRNLITSKLGNKTRQYLSFVGNIFFVIELDVAWVACEWVVGLGIKIIIDCIGNSFSCSLLRRSWSRACPWSWPCSRPSARKWEEPVLIFWTCHGACAHFGECWSSRAYCAL
jgi:hypothetical protein